MEVVKDGLSAVAEEVRRVRDRRGEVDRRRDDVGGERQPDGGRHVEHPVGPAVVVVAEGPSAPPLRDETVDDERSCDA